jgi:hypothetical protein
MPAPQKESETPKTSAPHITSSDEFGRGHKSKNIKKLRTFFLRKFPEGIAHFLCLFVARFRTLSLNFKIDKFGLVSIGSKDRISFQTQHRLLFFHLLLVGSDTVHRTQYSTQCTVQRTQYTVHYTEKGWANADNVWFRKRKGTFHSRGRRTYPSRQSQGWSTAAPATSRIPWGCTSRSTTGSATALPDGAATNWKGGWKWTGTFQE